MNSGSFEAEHLPVSQRALVTQIEKPENPKKSTKATTCSSQVFSIDNVIKDQFEPPTQSIVTEKITTKELKEIDTVRDSTFEKGTIPGATDGAGIAINPDSPDLESNHKVINPIWRGKNHSRTVKSV